MATKSTGQPPTAVDFLQCDISIKPNYAKVLKHSHGISKPIPMKPVVYLHGELHMIWEEKEVKKMIVNDKLQHAAIDKFLYG